MLMLAIDVLRGRGSEQFVYQTGLSRFVNRILQGGVTLYPDLAVAFNACEC